MGGLFFDNICVAIGVVILGLTKRGYDIRKELHRAKEGLLEFSNWREFLLGLVATLTIVEALRLIR